MKYTSQFGGEQYDLYFKTAKYTNNGSTAVQAFTESGEPYATVSVNLEESVGCKEYEFYADTNNCGDLVSSMIDSGYIKEVGDLGFSGFCVYPKVVLTPKFLAQYV